MHKKAIVSISSFTVWTALWTMPVLEQSYKKLPGLSTQARSDQMLAFQKVANCVAELLVVLVTDGGKILLYKFFFFFRCINNGSHFSFSCTKARSSASLLEIANQGNVL